MGKINKRDDEFKNQCIDYYINNQITKRQVADKFGCSEASLVRWAKSLDREDYFEISNLRGDNLKKINLTDQQKQIILGTLLGDGCINCRKKSSRRRTLHVAHGIDQFDYLKWKHDVIGGNKIRQYVTGFGGIGYCFTFTHPFIEQIWKSNYVDDKKCVGVDWIKSLGPIGFATWYQDDGSLNRLTKNTKIEDIIIQESHSLPILLTEIQSLILSRVLFIMVSSHLFLGHPRDPLFGYQLLKLANF